MLLARYPDDVRIQCPDRYEHGTQNAFKSFRCCAAVAFSESREKGFVVDGHKGSVIGKVQWHAVDEGAQFAGVDEESLLAAVAEAAFDAGVFVFREEPDADGNLRTVENWPERATE